MYGGSGNDTLRAFGNSGDKNYLYGNLDDTVTSGNNFLIGSQSIDYYFHNGNGTSTVTETNAVGIENAVIMSSLDFTVDDEPELIANNLNLIIRTDGDETNDVILKNFFTSENNQIGDLLDGEYFDAASANKPDHYAYLGARFGTTSADGFIFSGGSATPYSYNAYWGNDTITGNSYADTIFGDDGNDSISGAGGNDSLSGGADNDTISGGAGADSIDGGSGTDTADYSNDTVGINIDLTVTTAQATNSSESSGDTLSGIEHVTGGSGGDTIRGDSGGNILTGNDGADLLYGRGGNDTIYAGDDGDTIYGGDGNDSLDGSWGADEVYGENGDDNIQGSKADDTLDGGADDDTINAADGNDDIIGGAGADSLYGAKGNDDIDGGAGDDIIRGETGADTLFGGTGADTFEYHLEDGSNASKGFDIIEDFVSGTDEVLPVIITGFKFHRN